MVPVVAVVPISAVAVVLGWMVMGRVSLRNRRRRRIKADDTAGEGATIIIAVE